MKYSICLQFCLIFSALTLTTVSAQQASQQAVAELTFQFNRLRGNATNQFAVWIEDSQGRYVRTIYATRFTANGGFRRRDSSIPIWVRQSGVANLNKAEIDTITGATPRAGNLSYSWDGTNRQGVPVPNGEYVIVLEGTLRWANQVIYRAPIRLGQGTDVAQVSVEYIGDADEADRTMISNVRVRILR